MAATPAAGQPYIPGSSFKVLWWYWAISIVDFAQEQELWALLIISSLQGAFAAADAGLSPADRCYPRRYGSDPIDHIVLSGPLIGHAGPLRALPFVSPVSATRRLQLGAPGYPSDHCPLLVDVDLP